MGKLEGVSLNPEDFSHEEDDERVVIRGVFSTAQNRESAEQDTSFAFSSFSAPQAGWPQPLAKEAFHGLTGDFVNTVGPHTESDAAGLLVQFLVAFGNVIGRGAYFLVEATRHYSNLYTVLVGATSKSRKGTSWGHIKRIFEAIDQDWMENKIKDGLSSGEGLIWAVRDALTGDCGISDKRLMIVETEFVSTLKVMKREGSTLSPVIRNAWDSGDLNILNKNSPAKATNAHISSISHVTAEELIRYLDSSEYANGFGNRHLFTCVRRSKCLPEGGSLRADDLAPFIDQLKEIVVAIKELGDIRIKFDKTARRLWHEIYPELSSGKPGLLGSIIGRAEAQVIRLASIYALLDLSFKIKLVHLRAALAVWRYCEDSCRYIFAGKLGDPIADEILTELRSVNPEVMTRTDISKMFKGHKRAVEISRALSLLQELGLAEPEKQKTGGRNAEEWVAL